MSMHPDADRPSARDRLHMLYGAPGPYVSVYVACGPYAGTDPIDVFLSHRSELDGATDAALDAVAARLALPVPEDAGGRSVHAASDGTTIADFAPEGPAAPVVRAADLPMAAPLLEWDQWRVPHITVTVDGHGAQIAIFTPTTPPTLTDADPDPLPLVDQCRRLALDHRLRLIVIAGDLARVAATANRLVGVVPPSTRVVTLDGVDVAAADLYAEAVVRHVADVVARDTVGILEDFRFRRAGGHVVEGADNTLAALRAGEGQVLLVHDDPADDRTATFDAGPDTVHPTDGPRVARLVDVAIWAAIQRDLAIRVIPTTGDNGPRDDIGLLVEQPAHPLES